MTHSQPPGDCPSCARPLPQPAPTRCPSCALPLSGRVFDRVRWIDAELIRLDARRTALLTHRRRLLDVLLVKTEAAHAAGPPTAQPWPGARPGTHLRAPRQGEASPLTARNVLLGLGGVLLTVAAVAFTLLSWGSMGIGGRAMVLATVTLLALSLPALLLRRSLTATAEAVAGFGLVLLLLDAYALRQVSLHATDAYRYTAVVAAVVAALWASYGMLLPRPGLRGPLPTAVVLGQFALPLWAAGSGAGGHGMAWALLATAAADVLLATLTAGRGVLRPVRVTAAVTALLTAVPLLLLAGRLSAHAGEPYEALRVGVLLLTTAAVLLAAAGRERAFATGLACLAGLSTVAGTGGLVRALVPADWVVPGYLLSALVLAGVVAGRKGTLSFHRPSRANGLLLAAAAVQVLALLYGAPALAQALFEPLGWFGSPWQGGSPGEAGGPPGHQRPWVGNTGTFVVFAAPAVLLALASRTRQVAELRPFAVAAALATGWATAVAVPLTVHLPYAATTGWLVALAVAVAAVPALTAGRAAANGPTGIAVSLAATAAALVTSATALGWALADRTATFVALGVLTAAFAGATWRTASRGAAVHPARSAARALTAAAAVLCAAGLARAVPAAMDVPGHLAAYAVLAVVPVTALLAVRLRDAEAGDGPGTTAYAVEGSGYAVAAWAVLLSVPSAPHLASVLGACGVLAGGVALRPDRRRSAGYAAPALFLLATWVRLYASGVSVPEAYSLPLAVAALAMGVLRARVTERLSSWAAYGPALSCCLLPSLLMLVGEQSWLRPLLLGAGALAVTLVGARLRLQAPLLTGGVVLVLVVGHELAPYVTQVVGLLPRWLPPALAGALLLAAGATYEQRLRDARRLRAAWRRLG